jgi:hypothetical protein
MLFLWDRRAAGVCRTADAEIGRSCSSYGPCVWTLALSLLLLGCRGEVLNSERRRRTCLLLQKLLFLLASAVSPWIITGWWIGTVKSRRDLLKQSHSIRLRLYTGMQTASNRIEYDRVQSQQSALRHYSCCSSAIIFLEDSAIIVGLWQSPGPS